MRLADPNKLYEYAAAGRPIVTPAHSPDLEPLRGFVHLAETDQEFIEGIRLALSEGKDAERLLAFARSSSWRARADALAALITDRLGRTQGQSKKERA